MTADFLRYLAAVDVTDKVQKYKMNAHVTLLIGLVATIPALALFPKYP